MKGHFERNVEESPDHLRRQYSNNLNKIEESLEMKSLSQSVCITTALLFMASPINAATVTKVRGTDVNFTYDDATLYGAGWVVGNKLFFLPTDFENESTDGSNPGVVTDTLNILVSQNTPIQSFFIDSIEVGPSLGITF